MKTSTHALLNAITLSVACGVLNSVGSTTNQIEPRVVESMTHLSNGTYTGNGYLSLAFVNLAFAISGWFSPSLIAIFGPRVCLVVSSLGYALFASAVYQPTTWFLYFGSVLFGMTNSIFNASQSTFQALISNRKTIIRNSGIFLAMLQLGRAGGSVFVSAIFTGKLHILDDTRQQLLMISIPVALLGTLILLTLRPARQPSLQDEDERTNIQEEVLPLSEAFRLGKRYVLNLKVSKSQLQPATSPINSTESPQVKHNFSEENSFLKTAFDSFVLSLKLLGCRQMQLLFPLFCYCGFFATFSGTVYGTSISHTLAFGSSGNSLMTLSATVYSIANLCSALLSIAMAPVVLRRGRDVVMLAVYVLQMIVYYLAFLQLPPTSPLVDINFEAIEVQVSYVQPNAILLLCGSFVLGFTDAQMSSQIYSILQELNTNPSQSFTIYRFFYSISITTSFFLATVLTLNWQLLILVTFGTLATLGFFRVEMHCVRRQTYQTFQNRDEDIRV